MIVFPAFDANYKTRKRTFKCCVNCRSRRLKCVILSGDYDVKGCDNCRESGKSCDLVVGNLESPEVKKRKRTTLKSKKQSPSLTSPVEVLVTPPSFQPHAPHQVTSGPPPLQPPHTNLVAVMPERSLTGQMGKIPPHSHSNPIGDPSATAPPHLPPINPQLNPIHPHPYSNSHPHQNSHQNSHLSNSNPVKLESSYPHPGQFILYDPNIPHQPPMYPYPPLNGPNGSCQGHPTMHIPQGPHQMHFHEQHSGPSPSPTMPPIRPPPINHPTSSSTASHSSEPPHNSINLAPTPSSVGNEPSNGLHEHSSVGNTHSSIGNDTSRGSNSVFDVLPPLDTKLPVITPRYMRNVIGFNISNDKGQHQYIYQPTKTYTRREKKFREDETKWMDLPCMRNEAYFRYLYESKTFTLELNNQTIRELCELYFFKINSLFPIIYEPDFWEDFNQGNAPSLTVFCIVLVISRDPLAGRIFVKNGVFKPDQLHFEVINYMNNLDFKIRQMLNLHPLLDHSRLNLLICHLLLFLHVGFDKDGVERQRRDLLETYDILLSTRIGVELQALDFSEKLIETEQSVVPIKTDYLRYLWWVAVSFDRFNCIANLTLMIMSTLNFKIKPPVSHPILSKIAAATYNLHEVMQRFFNPTSAPLRDVKDNEAFIFDMVAQERTINELDRANNYADYKFRPVDNGDYLPNFSVEEYARSNCKLIERLTMNTSIICGNKQLFEKHLLEAGNGRINEISMRAAIVICDYLRAFEDLSQIVTISCVPVAMMVCTVVFIRHKVRLTLKEYRSPQYLKFNKKTVAFSDYFYNQLLELVDLTLRKWWFAEKILVETCKLSALLDKRLRIMDREDKIKAKAKSNLVRSDGEWLRDRIKIQSLLNSERVDLKTFEEKFPKICDGEYYAKAEYDLGPSSPHEDSLYVGKYMPTPKFIEESYREDWKAWWAEQEKKGSNESESEANDGELKPENDFNKANNLEETNETTSSILDNGNGNNHLYGADGVNNMFLESLSPRCMSPSSFPQEMAGFSSFPFSMVMDWELDQ